MKLIIRESSKLLGTNVDTADRFWRRFRGLMFADRLPEGGGLHIQPCRSVHTFFMKYPIDVLHLDAVGTIVGLEPELPPGRIGANVPRTSSVVELPAGTLERIEARIGQTVEFQEESETRRRLRG